MRIFRGSLSLHPIRHSRSGSQGFPAAVKSAKAGRSGSIDQVVPDFRMRVLDPAVELSIQNDAATNPRSDRDIDQTSFVLACAPSRFSESRCVGVVFHGDFDVE